MMEFVSESSAEPNSFLGISDESERLNLLVMLFLFFCGLISCPRPFFKEVSKKEMIIISSNIQFVTPLPVLFVL